MNPQNRVVVTGMGVVAPNGIGLDAFWDSLISCKSGIGPITLFDTSDLPLKVAGEIKNFNLRDYFGKDCKPNRLARQTQLGLAACKMAVEHAGLTKEIMQHSAPLSLVMGICSGAVDLTEQAKETVMTRGAKRVRPHIVGSCQPHAIGAALVQMLGVQTSVTTISAACPSGLDAVTAAFKMIKDGRTDLVIVGSADSPLNISTVASFCTAGIPSVSTEFPPDEISRPFDEKRSGVVLSEGAGFFVLERLDSTLARGAMPYMEIIGGATSTDTPGTTGMEGLFHSMNGAMSNAGIYPGQIDYICANAVGDRIGDRAETDLIKQIFGHRAYQLPVSSIRGVTGHPLAPAGMFQMIACALSLNHQIIIPTANLYNPDPECDLDYVALKFRSAKLDIMLANGHGMGGENSTVIMKRML
jgi:3-oxoacyl-[acyl-carrier-protein] synthase II